ncbi:MAG TPA: DNA primase [Caldisericia bacterium]|nr:DNA primase [Caldisericia bacterium]HPF48884.1 DNA primase [Caldisericia bacterium]HPI83252.1 DNA primase [Caldisericia bacterium]HPQ92479.1 DNA primase [Caldisericia bacterium]HRV74423.1 DNA primase [Caldisericia bacterium]
MDLDRVVEEIDSRLDIVSVVGRYVKLRKAGRNFVGLCPFHAEKTPSFSVSPDKRFFYCFGCKTGGNIVQFVSKIEAIPYMEALRILADEAGIELGEVHVGPKRDDDFELLSFVQDFFRKQFFTSKPARDYIENRGLTKQTIDTFQIGFSPPVSSALPRLLKEKDFDLEKAVKLGVLGVSDDGSKYGYMRGRITFPIRDSRGRVVAFGGRILGDGQPKYLNSQATSLFDKSKTLYAFDVAKREIAKEEKVIVVEGYMDAISMHQVGFPYTVATLGTAFTDGHARLLRRFEPTVYLFFDSDTAGKNAAVGAVKACISQGIDAYVVTQEDVKDPDDLAKTGKESVQKVLDESVHGLTFCVSYFISQEKNPDSPTAKSRLVKQAKEVADLAIDDISRNRYYEMISSLLRVPISILNKRAKIKPKVNLNTSPVRALYERQIIQLILNDDVGGSQILDIIDPDYFQDNTARNALEYIMEIGADLVKIESSLTDDGGGLSSFFAGIAVEEVLYDSGVFLEHVRLDLSKYRVKALAQKQKHSGLTSDECELYLRLQRCVNGMDDDKSQEKRKREQGREEENEEKWEQGRGVHRGQEDEEISEIFEQNKRLGQGSRRGKNSGDGSLQKTPKESGKLNLQKGEHDEERFEENFDDIDFD